MQSGALAEEEIEFALENVADMDENSNHVVLRNLPIGPDGRSRGELHFEFWEFDGGFRSGYRIEKWVLVESRVVSGSAGSSDVLFCAGNGKSTHYLDEIRCTNFSDGLRVAGIRNTENEPGCEPFVADKGVFSRVFRHQCHVPPFSGSK